MLWAARPPLSLSGSLERAPPCSHVQTCPDILCHTLHLRHKWPACWLAPTALHLLASPQLSCSQPHRHPVCVCVCVCVSVCTSAHAYVFLLSLQNTLLSVDFSWVCTNTYAQSDNLLCVFFTHVHTDTHSHPLFLSLCFSAACLLIFNVSPVHTQL